MRASWAEYFRARGLPEEEVSEIEEFGYDKIVDPDGVGPRIWFQPVPEGKVVKNRVHLDLDITDRTAPLEERKSLVDNEVQRLVGLGASVFRVLSTTATTTTASCCRTPRATSSACPSRIGRAA